MYHPSTRKAGVGAKQLVRRALGALTRRYPLMRGNGWLAHTRPLAALTAQPELVTARLRDGSRVRVHVNDLIGRCAFYTGDFDPAVSAVLRRVLRPADVCWDIGANYGVYALLAAQCVGPGGAVHAVEPQPELATLLRESASLNGYAHLAVHPVALSDADATARMVPPAHNLGGAALLPVERRPGEGFEVVTRRADAYMAAVEPRAPRLVKIDVEGHEDALLGAARAYLARVEPTVILFESHPRRSTAFDEREAVTVLRDLGYELFTIRRSWLGLNFEPQGIGAPPPRGVDFLALHSAKAEPALRRRLGLPPPAAPHREVDRSWRAS